MRTVAATLAILSTHLLAAAAASTLQPAAVRTRVVILGVGHSTQLVEERQQPAALRAFFDRVAPDAIGVERAPQEFERGDHYEFTYEIQYLAVPYARERGIPLHLIDWIPPREDLLLGFVVDLQPPREVRSGWRGFLSSPDPADVRLPLFFADSNADREHRRARWLAEWEPASRDLPRRPGGTLLVPVGANHKDDIERILTRHLGIGIIQPSSFGEPTIEEIEAALPREDLLAIASVNLLGAQATTGNADWDWMERVVRRLERDGATPDTRLLAARLAVLTGELRPVEAVGIYRRIRNEAGNTLRFTWTGVKNSTRVDSYFDPFGNLTIAKRAAVETARELYRMGRPDEAEAIRDEPMARLPPRKARQLRAYWTEHTGAVS